MSEQRYGLEGKQATTEPKASRMGKAAFEAHRQAFEANIRERMHLEANKPYQESGGFELSMGNHEMDETTCRNLEANQF